MKIKEIVKGKVDSKNTRIYFFESGETIAENIRNRGKRPYRKYRKLLPEIFSKVGIDPGTKANWSQFAGCSCPCSPGFVLNKPMGDIFVSLE